MAADLSTDTEDLLEIPAFLRRSISSHYAIDDAAIAAAITTSQYIMPASAERAVARRKLRESRRAAPFAVLTAIRSGADTFRKIERTAVDPTIGAPLAPALVRYGLRKLRAERRIAIAGRRYSETGSRSASGVQAR